MLHHFDKITGVCTAEVLMTVNYTLELERRLSGSEHTCSSMEPQFDDQHSCAVAYNHLKPLLHRI